MPPALGAAAACGHVAPASNAQASVVQMTVRSERQADARAEIFPACERSKLRPDTLVSCSQLRIDRQMPGLAVMLQQLDELERGG